MRRLFDRLFAGLFLSLIFLCETARAKDAAPFPVFGYAVLRGGTIKAYRMDDKTGDLSPVPQGEIIVDTHPILLAAHPSGRFLYVCEGFDEGRDGYYYEQDFTEEYAQTRRKKTIFRTFAIGADGRLILRQKLVLPGVYGGLEMHPTGRFLYAIGPGGGGAGDNVATVGPGSHYVGNSGKTGDPGGVAVLRVLPDGQLRDGGRTQALYTFSLQYGRTGERDAWSMNFTRDGKFLYSFCGDGFVDHSENYLRRFRVTPDGKFAPAGEIHQDRGEGADSVLPVGYPVFVPGGRWAILDSFGGLSLCQLDERGGLRPHRKRKIPNAPRPASADKDTVMSGYSVEAVDPKGRFFYTGEEGAINSVHVAYRLSERAGAIPVCTFGAGGGKLVAEPGGYFLYQWIPQYKQTRHKDYIQIEVPATHLTLFSVDDTGNVRERRPRRVFLNEGLGAFLFVTRK